MKISVIVIELIMFHLHVVTTATTMMYREIVSSLYTLPT